MHVYRVYIMPCIKFFFCEQGHHTSSLSQTGLLSKQIVFLGQLFIASVFLNKRCLFCRHLFFIFTKRLHFHKACPRRSRLLCSYTLVAKETILSTNSPSYADHHVNVGPKKLPWKTHLDFVRPPPKARPVTPQARPPQAKPRPVSAPVPPPKARPMMPAPKARPVQTVPRPVQPQGVGHPKWWELKDAKRITTTNEKTAKMIKSINEKSARFEKIGSFSRLKIPKGSKNSHPKAPPKKPQPMFGAELVSILNLERCAELVHNATESHISLGGGFHFFNFFYPYLGK